MTRPNRTLMGSLKKTWVSIMRGVKRFAGNARERVEIDTEFARIAVRVARLRKGMVNLNATFLAVFNKEASTLTLREGDVLEQGELVEVDANQYRVHSVGSETVEVAVEVNHRVHQLPCRVSTLQKV